jgi:hypothetical protein
MLTLSRATTAEERTTTPIFWAHLSAMEKPVWMYVLLVSTADLLEEPAVAGGSKTWGGGDGCQDSGLLR